MFPTNNPNKKKFALESGTIPGQPNNKKIKLENDSNNNNNFTLGTFKVEIPEPSIDSNTATLSLDNTSIDLVQTQYRGHLELPDRDLNPVVQFNTNGYNYATSLDIDVSNIDITPPSTDVNDNEISVNIPADPNWVDDDDAEGVVNIDDFLNNELVNDNQFDERYATSININLSEFREQCYKDMQLQSNENETKSGTIPFEIKSNGTYTIGDFDNVEGQEIVKDNQNRKGKMTIVKTDSIKNTKDVESTPFKPPNVGTFVVNVPIQPNKEQTIHENNSITTITPDTGYDAMQHVTVTVDVPENDPYLYNGEIDVSTNDNNKTIGELMYEQSIEAQGLSPECTLNVNTEPNLQNRTITIDSIESNSSQVVTVTGIEEYVNLMPIMSSDNYNNGEIIVTGGPTTNTEWGYAWYMFDDDTTSTMWSTYPTNTGTHWFKIHYNEKKNISKFVISSADYYGTSFSVKIVGTNNEMYNDDDVVVYESNENIGRNYYNYEQTFPNNYKFNNWFFICVGYPQINNLILYSKIINSNYDGLGSVTIINNTDSKIYKGYTSNNPLEITSKGNGVINIPNNYQALGEINYNVTIPLDVNNYNDYTTNNPLQITSRGDGTITIPEGYSGLGEINYNVAIPSDVNNYTNYNSSSPFQIEYSETNTTGVITIPEGYTGLGEIHFEIVKAKKRAVKYGLTYGSQTKYLISSMPNAGGSYTIHRYYGEGNTTQIFINPTTNEVISLASSGDSWSLHVPATFKHDELGTGNSDTTNYSLCLYDENDNVIYSLRNQTGSSGSYTKFVNKVPDDIEIVV